MRLDSCFFGLLCSVTLSGCNVTFPQLDSAISRVKLELAKQRESSPSEDIRWIASFNGEGRIMTAYVENGLTVFVSDEGDAIAFDGWLVRAIGGFGSASIIRIQQVQNQRVVIEGQRTNVIVCNQWVKSVFVDGQTIWSQFCAGQATENRLVLNADGLIIEIHQGVSDGGAELAMRKL